MHGVRTLRRTVFLHFISNVTFVFKVVLVVEHSVILVTFLGTPQFPNYRRWGPAISFH
jgi:hypothetical protein